MNSIFNMKNKLGFLRVFGVSAACYLPAILIVLLSHFWFGSSNKPSQNFSSAEQTLTNEQKKYIAEEVKKVLEQQPQEVEQARVQQEVISKIQTSIIAKEYIDGQIQQTAKVEAAQAAKGEIDRLQADWKGDLFGQITFPVVFAIASIFAAFAVKDILTEILKDQEKEKLKKEIEQELLDQIVPAAVESSQSEINRRIETIESYAYLLEYQITGILVNRSLNNEDRESSSISEDIRKNNQLTIEKLLDRATTALLMNADKLRGKDWEVFKAAECLALTAQIQDAGLSETSKNKLLEKLAKGSQIADEKEKEDPYSRIDDVIEVQLRLLIRAC